MNYIATKNKLSDANVIEILRLHQSGVSMCELGRKFNVSHRSIGWRLKKNKIDSKGNLIPINRIPLGQSLLGTGKFDWDKFCQAPEEEKAYWAGFIAADGCIMKNTLKIEISVKDADHLNWWKQFSATIKEYPKHSSIYMTATNHHLINWLNGWGIYPRKTGKEIFPKNKPKNLIVHWLRGLIDGDGYFSICTGCVLGAICSASEEFLKDIQSFIKSCNIDTNLRSFYIEGKLPHYKLMYYQRMSFRLSDLVMGDIKLNRKWDKVAYAKKNQYGMPDATIEKIHKLREEGLSLRAIAKEVKRSFSAVRWRVNQRLNHGL